MQEFGVLFIFSSLSVILGLIMLWCSILAAPRAGNPEKNSPYECGIDVKTDARIKFNIQFFVFAILFLIFDIETIFIFPFALSFDILGVFVFIETAIFLFFLLAGLVYAIKTGMLRFR